MVYKIDNSTLALIICTWNKVFFMLYILLDVS